MLKKFFKNAKNQPVEPIFPGESFTIYKLNLEDGWGLATINSAYNNYPNKKFFPCHVLVELEVKNPNENGHPFEEETIRLHEIEQEIIELLKQNQTVHFIGRVIRNGFRDILLYIDEPNTPEEIIYNYCDSLMEERAINFEMSEDKEWSNVGFLK